MCAVKWVSKDTVAVLWMNRLQNTSFHTICHPPQYACLQVIFMNLMCLCLKLTALMSFQSIFLFLLQIHVERVSEKGGKGWVENRGLPIFKSSGKEMALIEPIREGDAGYFPHLVHGIVSTTQVIPAIQLTQGEYEVTKVVGWDEKSDQM